MIYMVLQSRTHIFGHERKQQNNLAVYYLYEYDWSRLVRKQYYFLSTLVQDSSNLSDDIYIYSLTDLDSLSFFALFLASLLITRTMQTSTPEINNFHGKIHLEVCIFSFRSCQNGGPEGSNTGAQMPRTHLINLITPGHVDVENSSSYG